MGATDRGYHLSGARWCFPSSVILTVSLREFIAELGQACDVKTAESIVQSKQLYHAC